MGGCDGSVILYVSGFIFKNCNIVDKEEFSLNIMLICLFYYISFLKL